MASNISEKNSEFWNELCGTIAARRLGINEISRESLQKFDDWFFQYYPYLIPYLDKYLKTDNSQSILEVGIGYGSVSRYLGNRSNLFILDIAYNPVHSLKLVGYDNIKPTNGSILDAPFSDSSLDAVVAIGSLHHTGDFEKAINEICRILKPGGLLIGMVYNLLSLRVLFRHPIIFFKHILFFRDKKISGSENLRKEADSNLEGEAAPYTDYFTAQALKDELKSFEIVDVSLNNFFGIPHSKLEEPSRKIFLKLLLVKFLGLDIYFVAKKL